MIATLERVAFKTSRLAEFCSQKELIAQNGQAVADWPMVILKELVDNALDACEEAEIAPEITIEVSAETGEIVIADNGPGLPPATIEAILDYTSRVSSREAYVSPTRGAQGNALKTVIAMAFALDGNRGVTIIEAHGQAHRIIFEMDPVRREPRVLREISSSVVQIGTRVTVRWPNSASSVLEEAEARFVQIAGSFTTFNPHLSLSVRGNGDELVNISATDFGWRKWRACDPTNAHWYDVERFGRYMAAHIARDQDDGRIGRTVAEFIAELRGLSRSDKRKLVLAEAKASGVSLSSFFEGGEGKVERLLTACKVQTEPVKPQQLGIIGSDHLLAECLALGGAEESFKYKRHIGVNDFGPYVLEAAFAYCPDDGDDHDATIITGVNFSVGIQNPFERLGPLLSLSSLLEHQRAGRREPIVFILNYTCPRIDYADRGKSGVYLPEIVTTYIYDLVTKVTADWAKQRKREERDSSRQRERRDRLVSTQKVTIKDAAFEVMERAYDKASGGYPAKARQIMYAARPEILSMTGKDTLSDQYFTQTLLVDYMKAHPERCADWDVVWDARGNFTEPHTDKEIPLGTLEVRQYLGDRPAFGTTAGAAFDDQFPTSGPKNRFDTVLYVEKEGFESLLKAARLAERFDIAIMTTKGMSVTAARLLLDRLSEDGNVRQILALHDFDVSGFSIFGTLGTSNRRYKFENKVPLVDIGLRLANVQQMDLESEPAVIKGEWGKRAATLRRHGAKEEEVTFLRNRRVELNAMTSLQLVDFIETKLVEHRVTKLIPDAETIERQARRVLEHRLMERSLAQASKQIAEQVKEATLPEDLLQLIKDELDADPALSWDMAVASIIRNDR